MYIYLILSAKILPISLLPLLGGPYMNIKFGFIDISTSLYTSSTSFSPLIVYTLPNLS